MGRQIAAGCVLIQHPHRLLFIGRFTQLSCQARHAQHVTDMAPEASEHDSLADPEGPAMAGDQGTDPGGIQVAYPGQIQNQAAAATGQSPSHGSAQVAHTASHAQRPCKVKNDGPAMLILSNRHRCVPSFSPVPV